MTTHADQTIKITNLQKWYTDVPYLYKAQNIKRIMQSMEKPSSFRTVENWVKGQAAPKSDDALQALEAVTGLSRDTLFEFAEN